MLTRRLLLALTFLVITTPMARVVAADPLGGGCLRFDDLSAETPLTVYRGVAFTNDDGGLTVKAESPGLPFSRPNSVLPDFPFAANRNRATPPVPFHAATVTLGDYGADEDAIYLAAYDASGSLVDSDTDVLPLSDGGINLHVRSVTTDIAYIEFGAVDNSGQNSVYFDNVCFTG